METRRSGHGLELVNQAMDANDGKFGIRQEHPLTWLLGYLDLDFWQPPDTSNLFFFFAPTTSIPLEPVMPLSGSDSL